MRKNRERQRANRKKYRKEESLNIKNEYGIKDLTPYSAVRVMKGKEIVYK